MHVLNEFIFSPPRSTPPQPVDFKFDESLLYDYNGPLKPNQLALDDMTFEALREK